MFYLISTSFISSIKRIDFHASLLTLKTRTIIRIRQWRQRDLLDLRQPWTDQIESKNERDVISTSATADFDAVAGVDAS